MPPIRSGHLTVAICLLAIGAIAGAQVPTGGVSLLPSPPNDGLSLSAVPNSARVTDINVTGQPFTKAKRFETLIKPTNDWDVQADAWSATPVKVGDVVLATVYIRVAPVGGAQTEGKATFQFETEGPNWSKSEQRWISAGKAWKRYFMPFVVKYDSPATKAHFGFRLGYEPQAVEIGGFSIVNYGTKVKLSDLPNTSFAYPGDTPDAPWRIAANQRIDKLRKGDLTVQVINSAGIPIKNAKVQVRMKRHAFGFGSCIAPDILFDEGTDGRRYREIVTSNYNIATIENHLKWPFFETWGRVNGLKAVNWLKNNQIRLRAHNIIWPGWSNLPDDLQTLKSDPAKLKDRINRHITEMTTVTKGLAAEWDVVNEAYSNHDLMDILGWDVVADWFKRTKQGDPKPRLTLNDWPELDGNATGDDHLNQFAALIEKLQSQKAPIEAIGFQCHFGGGIVPPERVLTGLDRFAKYGLPIAITEFDMNTSDADLQARYMRDFMTAAFSHPAVDQVVMWGFWENAHWLPSAALYNRDWSIRPHGQVWLDLVKRDWWTNATGTTNQRGTYTTRAFFGDYELTTTVAGRTYTLQQPFTNSSRPFRIQVR